MGFPFSPTMIWPAPISDYDYSLDIFGTPQIPHFDFDQRVLGGQSAVQYFYEGPKKCKCCINWVEKEPVEIPQAAKDKYDSAAIHVYKAKDHDKNSAVFGGVTATHYQSIQIQSQIISDLIRPILVSDFLSICQEDIYSSRAYHDTQWQC